MAISFRKWTSKRLLYPIAIFAIIAPTVVMGLFGAYALRVVELRPETYKEQINQVQANLNIHVEIRLSELSIELPSKSTGIAPVTKMVNTYLADFDKALARKAWVGIDGEVLDSASVDSSKGVAPPPEVEILLKEMAEAPIESADTVRRNLTIRQTRAGETLDATFMAFMQPESKVFLVWEINLEAMLRLVDDQIASMSLQMETLEITRKTWTQMQVEGDNGLQMVGYAPIHSAIGSDNYVVLQLDADKQLFQDNKFLSHVFILLAVLTVPIVASATLMVVHMILREASEARKKVSFVSNVTHELKTPLTSIRMFAETLRLGRVKTKEQADACLDTIMTETDRLGSLIDHVLSFSKMENQVKIFNFQPANLAKVVRDTVSLFRAQMKGNDGDIRLKIMPGLPSQAEMDKDAIREVILNLLSNAIKYSGDEKFVTVLVGVDKNDLFIEVADRGIGIDLQDHDKIFDKFHRVDEALTRVVDGTGLGLAICKEIVQAHKGRITVESARGKGSRFTVYIPYKRGSTKRPTSQQMPVLEN
ncbi:MAG: cell wall metabolism sensor histidine kinase WalK [Planctomycetes bacterium]|nr:cell wall metabolism sensor histidine kinase WalK [Planctomycetota bacterium]